MAEGHSYSPPQEAAIERVAHQELTPFQEEVRDTYGKIVEEMEILPLGERPSFYIDVSHEEDSTLPPHTTRVDIINELRAEGIFCNTFGNDISGIALEPDHLEKVYRMAQRSGHHVTFGIQYIADTDNSIESRLRRERSTAIVTHGEAADYTGGGIIAAKRGNDFRHGRNGNKRLPSGSIVISGIESREVGGSPVTGKNHEFTAFKPGDLRTNPDLFDYTRQIFEFDLPEIPPHLLAPIHNNELRYKILGDRELPYEQQPCMYVFDMMDSSSIYLGDPLRALSTRLHWFAYNRTLLHYFDRLREEEWAEVIGVSTERISELPKMPFDYLVVEQTSECLALIFNNEKDMKIAKTVQQQVRRALAPEMHRVTYFDQSSVVQTARGNVEVVHRNGTVVFSERLPLTDVSRNQKTFKALDLGEGIQKGSNTAEPPRATLHDGLYYTTA